MANFVLQLRDNGPGQHRKVTDQLDDMVIL